MLSQKIKQKALELGYLGCGIIPAEAIEGYNEKLDERTQKYPASKELYGHFYKMGKPREGSKSLIVVTRRFNQYKIPAAMSRRVGKTYLVDGRVPYSHEDRAMREFTAYLGTLGLAVIKGNAADRWAAARAGLGKFGRNNFIYSKEHGSNIWINAWYVDKELEYDAVQEVDQLSACSEKCNKCVQACPTKALKDGFSMDMGKCITFLQFEDENPEELLEHMGEWLYGCDACQDVCPQNKNKYNEAEEFPLLPEFMEYLEPEVILNMDEDTYKKVLSPRFWYAGEEGLWQWKRNALRCMVNSGDAKYHEIIKQCCDHEDERLRKIAQWGCRQLG